MNKARRKFFLFKQSQHFCSVPWNHVEIWTDGSVRTCCKGQRFGNVNQQPLQQIVRDPYILALKKDLLDDQVNPNCVECYQSSTGKEHFDLRNHYNPMFQSFDIDYDNVQAFQLNGIDLHWDNTCNFKCIYCNAEQSSLIASEQHQQVQRSNDQTIASIIDQIVENQYHIKEIYFSGGEPLLVKHNHTLLNKIHNKDLPIRINSNLSQAYPGNAVFDALQKFQNVLWTVSAESMHERFEYIRQGGSWSQFIHNLEQLIRSHHSVRVNSVWFVGSMLSLFDTIDHLINNYSLTDFTVNQLTGHPYLHVRHAPQNTRELALQKLQKLLDSGAIVQGTNAWYNIARCKNSLMENGQIGLYANYLDNLDSLRGTQWKQVFPELVV